MIPTWTLIRSTHFSIFDTLIQFIHCLESGCRVIRQIHQTKILSKWWKSEHCVWSSVESFSKILIRPAWTILTDSSASHHIDQTAMFQGQEESIVVSTDHDMYYVGRLGTRGIYLIYQELFGWSSGTFHWIWVTWVVDWHLCLSHDSEAASRCAERATCGISISAGGALCLTMRMTVMIVMITDMTFVATVVTSKAEWKSSILQIAISTRRYFNNLAALIWEQLLELWLEHFCFTN